jgi:hypothetical protein
MAKSIAFNRAYAPSDWAPASAFREMQQAPDYRQDLDLFIVAPNGDYVSFCTIWIDERNKYGKFEPVGTHAEYQGMGLAGFADGRVQTYGATWCNTLLHGLAERVLSQSWFQRNARLLFSVDQIFPGVNINPRYICCRAH